MSITKHYSDTFTLEFNPTNNKRRYVHVEENVIYMGITTLLSKVIAKDLTWWVAKCAANYVLDNLQPGIILDEVQINKLVAGASRAHLDIRDSAATSGTFVHDWLHSMVRGNLKPLPTNPEMQAACVAALEWYDEKQVDVVLAEQPLVSKKLRLAGTPDLIAYIDGKLTILDWKTGKSLYYEQLIQMAFYAIMFEEEFGIKIEQFILVNASMKSPFKTFTTKQTRALIADAKGVYKLYKSMVKFEDRLSRGDRV